MSAWWWSGDDVRRGAGERKGTWRFFGRGISGQGGERTGRRRGVRANARIHVRKKGGKEKKRARGSSPPPVYFARPAGLAAPPRPVFRARRPGCAGRRGGGAARCMVSDGEESGEPKKLPEGVAKKCARGSGVRIPEVCVARRGRSSAWWRGWGFQTWGERGTRSGMGGRGGEKSGPHHSTTTNHIFWCPSHKHERGCV